MGYKEEFLFELIRSDRTGLLPRLHECLIENQLKYRASSNSDTLLYYVLDREKKQVGLAAFRVPGPTIFSFPKTYWQRRSTTVDAALSALPPSSIIETSGAVSSSQHSMRQVIVSAETGEILLHVIEELISPHARSTAA
jgi:hypothetical protein